MFTDLKRSCPVDDRSGLGSRGNALTPKSGRGARMVLNEPKVDATGSRRRGPRAPEHPQRLVLPEPLEDLGGGAPALRAHARGSGAAPGGRAHRSSTAPTTPTCPTTCRWRR